MSARWAKRLGLGLAVVVAVFVIVWSWVIPAVIVSQIQAAVVGKVTIQSWWLNGHSAGVVGLTLHEGPTARSPVFAAAERVATDLSSAESSAAGSRPA